jgi:hypothetical protein
MRLTDVQRSDYHARFNKNQQRNENEDIHSNGYGWNGESYQQTTNSRPSSFEHNMIYVTWFSIYVVLL